MFFVLASFGALVVDRDVSRARLAEAVVLNPATRPGRGSGSGSGGWLAGVLLGLACASKQYAFWYIFAFAGLCIAWDIGARRTVGLRAYVRGALVRDGKWLPVTLGVIPLVTYVLTWTGWFATSTGYDRNYAQLNGVNIPIIGPLYSLFEYHKEMFQFGVGAQRAPPLRVPAVGLVPDDPPGRVLLGELHQRGRHPTWPSPARPARGCRRCWRSATPRSGGLSIPAIVFCLAWWLTRRDWRAGAAPARHRGRLGELAAVHLADQVLLLRARVRAVPHHLHRALPGPDPRLGDGGPVGAGRSGRVWSALYLVAVVILFFYFYPIMTAQVIPYTDWFAHMWWPIGVGWI